MDLESEKTLTLGVDLGGTKVETALVRSNGHIVASHKYPTNSSKGSEAIIDDIIACIEGCLGKARQEARALGVGIAGQVNLDGVVSFSPNLRWRNVPLQKILEDKLKMPVVVVNDVRAATWGEWRFGSGKGVDDLVVLFVGTGIGGGVISGGNMLNGCTNISGELGHMTIVVDGRKCHCPNSGCLEAYAGGWAIAERAQQMAKADPSGGRELISLAGKIENITAVTVSDAFREGDQLANRVVEDTGRYLGAGIVGIVNAFNPCLLILGGGVIEGLPELMKIVETFTLARALKAAVENFKVTKAALGNEAGIVGAANIAQNKIQKVIC